jgi:hypothetical protein
MVQGSQLRLQINKQLLCFLGNLCWGAAPQSPRLWGPNSPTPPERVCFFDAETLAQITNSGEPTSLHPNPAIPFGGGSGQRSFVLTLCQDKVLWGNRPLVCDFLGVAPQGLEAQTPRSRVFSVRSLGDRGLCTYYRND